jgi:phage terminase Nu1 subunit (DNA packaging protein)
MTQVSASELAIRLDVSRGRVSQWVAEGKLRGCYTGEGRARRFDLDAVRVALGRNLDTAQALGNGRATLAAIGAISDPDPGDDLDDGDGLINGTKARYDAARTLLTEERARAARYDNAQREGTLVLASEVEAQVLAQIGQELAQVDAFLRVAAKDVAAATGADARVVRAVLTAAWRRHRGERAVAADTRAAGAKPSPAERAADF